MKSQDEPYGWYEALVDVHTPRPVRNLHVDAKGCRCFMCHHTRNRTGENLTPVVRHPRQPWDVSRAA